MALTIEKSFFLKQVDPLLVAKLYLSGELLMPTSKVLIDESTITPDLEIGPNNSSEVYEIMDKNGEYIRIITTDNIKWKNPNSEYKYVCHWCRISHNGEPIIIPIKLEKDHATGNLVFSGTGNYCCFECAYADLKTKWYCGFYQKNSLYTDAETLLRFMYHLYTKKENLVASPDWVLHEKNGGALSNKDFYNSKHTYVHIPNIIMSNIKTTHIQSDK